jgi:hypothetical protein
MRAGFFRCAAVVAVAVMAAGTVGCKGGAPACTYKHQNPGFCLAPPPGFDPLPESTASYGSMMGFNNKVTGFDLKWGGPYPFDDRIKSAKVRPAPNSPIKVVAEGDLENGGFWTHRTSMNNGKPYHTLSYLVKGKTGGVECDAGTADTAMFETLLAACKTLRVD